MAIAATIVVSVSLIAEKSKPFIAAMLATLPISGGPALVFIALDHDDIFLHGSLIGAMLANIAAGLYCLAYGFAARRFSAAPSIAIALSGWAVSGLVLRQFEWNVPLALLATFLIYAALIPASRQFLAAPMPAVPPRAWYAIPLRALAVAALVAAVTTLSWTLGPNGSGMLAVFPIVLSSLVAILHPRIGGAATARTILSGLPGLLGFGVALAIAAMLTLTIGRYAAMAVGLGICLIWNGALVMRRARLT